MTTRLADRRYDLEVVQGDDFYKEIVFRDRDLTGAALRMQVRDSYAGDVFVDLDDDVDGGLSMSYDAESGDSTVSIAIPRAVTGAIDIDLTARPGSGRPSRRGVYDFEITPDAGRRKTEFWGDFTFWAEVTRDE